MKNKNSIHSEPHLYAYRVTARLMESREYIQKVELEESFSEVLKRAVAEGWFGVKSKDMTRRIIAALYSRYSQYPKGLCILKNSLDTMDSGEFRLISQFHLVLADPYYRWLTGVYFPQRRSDGFGFLSLDELVVEFSKIVQTELKPVTIRSYCSKLLTIARDVGLLKGKVKKEFEEPEVSEKALLYVLLVWKSMSLPFSDFLEFEFYKSVFTSDRFLRVLDLGYVQNLWDYQIGEGYFSCTIQEEKAKEIFGMSKC